MVCAIIHCQIDHVFGGNQQNGSLSEPKFCLWGNFDAKAALIFLAIQFNGIAFLVQVVQWAITFLVKLPEEALNLSLVLITSFTK